MAYQEINNGTTAGDGTGEMLFDALDKVNANFEELYGQLGAGVITSTVTTKQNDYAPTGWAACRTLIWTGAASVEITGFDSTGIEDGAEKVIVNGTSSYFLTLKDQSTDSVAASRCLLPDAKTLYIPPLSAATIFRNATSSRWMLRVWPSTGVRIFGTTVNGMNVLANAGANVIDESVFCSTIAGGGRASGTSVIDATEADRNAIGVATYTINYGGSTIEDQAGYSAGTADVATIGGGYDNLNNAEAGTIAGGGHNALGYLSTHGVIGGGSKNAVVAASDYATIAGGTINRIGETAAADSSTIGGGISNSVKQGNYNTIAGGSSNTITGASANSSTIVGGVSNTANGNYCVLGGQSNTIGSFTGAVAFGVGNAANANYEIVVGWSNSSLTGGDGAITFGGSGNPWSGSVGASQAVSFTQNASTTDNSTTVYSYNRSTTAPTVPLNSAVAGRITVLGKVAAQTSVVMYVCDFVVSRAGSGTIIVEQENWTAIKDEPTIGAAPAIRAGVNVLQLSLLGASGVTVRWTVRFDAVVAVAP